MPKAVQGMQPAAAAANHPLAESVAQPHLAGRGLGRPPCSHLQGGQKALSSLIHTV